MLGLTWQGYHKTVSVLLLSSLGMPDTHICFQSSISGGIWDATRGLLATDHVILNHGQVTWTTPELAPALLTTTPHQWEDISALDRFNVHRCPIRVSAEDKGCQAYPLDPRLDALALYSGCTPGGEPKSVKCLRSCDPVIETSSALRTKSFLFAKTFLNSPVTISPHKPLNSCRGVIYELDLLTTPEAKIFDGFSDQGGIQPNNSLVHYTSEDVDMILYDRDDEPVSRVPSMAHDTIFWARQRSKWFAFYFKIRKFTMKYYEQARVIVCGVAVSKLVWLSLVLVSS
ncbi:uncharacterized protein TNCV_4647681 [Trichonephila clavipes]|uniref:Uncharacterized protein n=1 Tax=Trichonephila clavipes TaxID=2585209 RepID=A0A8X6T3X1_TRICX|nr:uncharacterized protein TNCV_4647681 [Trichonephila clavipes]